MKTTRQFMLRFVVVSVFAVSSCVSWVAWSSTQQVKPMGDCDYYCSDGCGAGCACAGTICGNLANE